MLEIRPVTEKHAQEALAARFGVAFEKEAFAYAAYSDDAPVALCQFKIKDETIASLLSLGVAGNAPDDMTHALLIGILSFCMQSGIRALHAASVFPSEAMERLGLTQDSDTGWLLE